MKIVVGIVLALTGAIVAGVLGALVHSIAVSAVLGGLFGFLAMTFALRSA